MDFSFTEEAEAVRELAEQVFTGSMTVERVKEIEASDERIDRELWKELASTGLLGIGLPEAHGGAGLGLVEVCLTLSAQGRQVAPVPLLADGGRRPDPRRGRPRQKLLPGRRRRRAHPHRRPRARATARPTTVAV